MKLTRINLPSFSLELTDEEAAWLTTACNDILYERGRLLKVSGKREHDFILELGTKLSERNINR